MVKVVLIPLVIFSILASAADEKKPTYEELRKQGVKCAPAEKKATIVNATYKGNSYDTWMIELKCMTKKSNYYAVLGCRVLKDEKEWPGTETCYKRSSEDKTKVELDGQVKTPKGNGKPDATGRVCKYENSAKVETSPTLVTLVLPASENDIAFCVAPVQCKGGAGQPEAPFITCRPKVAGEEVSCRDENDCMDAKNQIKSVLKSLREEDLVGFRTWNDGLTPHAPSRGQSSRETDHSM